MNGNQVAIVGVAPQAFQGTTLIRSDAWLPDWNVVTPGFFRTLNIALVRGRDFSGEDVAGPSGAIIVNEAMARRPRGTTDVTVN